MDIIKSRAWAEINLGALKHNLDIARRHSKPVMCVIKADAYGHGAIPCAKFLQENGASAFAVACLNEAIQLRENNITLPILALSYTPCDFVSELAYYDVIQTLVDEESAKLISDAAIKAHVTINAHIKLDTGMGRTGLLAQGRKSALEAADAAERIMALPNIKVTGMYTHFSVADIPSEAEYTAWQMDNFMTVIDELTKRGKRPAICHTSNSAAILSHSETILDMVRAGIMLYGMYPDSRPSNGELEPVMTLKSRVSQVRELPLGSSLSYGRTFISERDMLSAVISSGYADGFPRRLSGKTFVAINGSRYPQVGTICMDTCMADVTGGNVKQGDEVILFGSGGMSIEEISQIVGTINYELTCLVTGRVPRLYING